MSKLPTIQMRKDTAIITVNESDTEQWVAQGFAVVASIDEGRKQIDAEQAEKRRLEQEAADKAEAEANAKAKAGETSKASAPAAKVPKAKAPKPKE